ncbi:MAG: helix-turn-helix domain-containing protein [Flavobacteriales bacterium]
MTIDFNILAILTLVVLAQGVFAAVLLFTSEKNRLPNRFLGLLILAFSFWMLDTFYNVSGLYIQNPNLYFQPVLYSLAFGPLIYFYIKSLINKGFKFKKSDLFHFIPVLIQIIFYCYLTLQDYEFRRWFWLEVHQPTTYDLEFYLTLISLVIYLFLSIRVLAGYQNWLKENFSEYSKIKLNWLKVLLIVLMVLSLIWGVDAVLKSQFHIYRQYDYSEISLGFVIIFLAYGGVKQSSLKEVFYDSDKKAKVSGKERVVDEVLVKFIHNSMETEQFYLNPVLSLKEFAQSIHKPSKLISEHINYGMNKSFVEFVNSFRVQAVLNRINDGDLKEFTLLSIALDSGFNSKSTFNRVFKKHLNESPSEYIKRTQKRD